jgi:hypothetical protein
LEIVETILLLLLVKNCLNDLAEEELGAVRFASKENKLDAESVWRRCARCALLQEGEQSSVARLCNEAINNQIE